VLKTLIRNPFILFGFAKQIRSLRVAKGYCTICGKSTYFIRTGNNLRETFICLYCSSNSRNRHLAKILCETFNITGTYSLHKFGSIYPSLRIYEAEASGSIHDNLVSLPNYTCSEFFSNIPIGSLSETGIRCEDLQQLSFRGNSFDLIITQDVFEHIRNPESAWKEVYRVLKVGGFHIFTIPWINDRKTMRRIRIEGSTEITILPNVFHGDGIRDGRVYTDFGGDLIDYLDSLGFVTRIFYSTDADSKLYSIYGNIVFVSRRLT
jgi:SAM-dependent methyltransferase